MPINEEEIKRVIHQCDQLIFADAAAKAQYFEVNRDKIANEVGMPDPLGLNLIITTLNTSNETLKNKMKESPKNESEIATLMETIQTTAKQLDNHLLGQEVKEN